MSTTRAESTVPVLPEGIADSVFGRNVFWTATGEGIWGFMANFVTPATVLTVLLARLGAGERMIGSIGAIETGGLALPQALGIFLFHSRRRRQTLAILWHLFPCIPFLFLSGAVAFAAEGHLSARTARWLLLATLAGYQLCIGVVVAAWLDWLAHLYDQSRRGTAFGVTFATAAVGSFAGSLLAGVALGDDPTFRTFGWLYVAAGVLAVISICSFWFVRDPGLSAPESPPPTIRELLHRFRHSLADVNFRGFLIGRTLSAFGFCILPFVALYFTSPQGGGLSGGTVVKCFAAFTAGSATAHLMLGRLGDRYGHRLGVLMGAVMQVVTLSLLLIAQGVLGCIAVYICAGFCASSAWLSHSNLLFETCPHDNRMAHITVGNLSLTPALIAAPLVAGWVARVWGLQALFAGSLAISLAALAWFVLRVREPRHISISQRADSVDGGRQGPATNGGCWMTYNGSHADARHR